MVDIGVGSIDGLNVVGINDDEIDGNRDGVNVDFIEGDFVGIFDGVLVDGKYDGIFEGDIDGNLDGLVQVVNWK